MKATIGDHMSMYLQQLTQLTGLSISLTACCLSFFPSSQSSCCAFSLISTKQMWSESNQTETPLNVCLKLTLCIHRFIVLKMPISIKKGCDVCFYLVPPPFIKPLNILILYANTNTFLVLI